LMHRRQPPPFPVGPDVFSVSFFPFSRLNFFVFLSSVVFFPLESQFQILHSAQTFFFFFSQNSLGDPAFSTFCGLFQRSAPLFFARRLKTFFQTRPFLFNYLGTSPCWTTSFPGRFFSLSSFPRPPPPLIVWFFLIGFGLPRLMALSLHSPPAFDVDCPIHFEKCYPTLIFFFFLPPSLFR